MNLPEPAVWVLARVDDIDSRSPLVVISRKRYEDQQENTFHLGQDSVLPI